ncbi:hypothetical protein PG988_006708 [Apiospora saccharicola]
MANQDTAYSITQGTPVIASEFGKVKPTNDIDNGWYCGSGFNQGYYHCSTCNSGDLKMCAPCVKAGRHCKDGEHWLVECKIKDGGLSVRSHTQAINTGWVLIRTKEATEHFTLSLTRTWVLDGRKWRRSDKKPRFSKVLYDYCHLCSATFPVDEPPERHEWEEHGAEAPPAEQPARDTGHFSFAPKYSKTPSGGPSPHVWVKTTSEERV